MKEFPIIESNEIILRELELTDNDNYFKVANSFDEFKSIIESLNK